MSIKVKYATMIVKNMEESVTFYRDVMGFEVDSRYDPQPGTAITLMQSKGGAMVELIQNDTHNVGFYSVGMDVDNLADTLEDLKAKGAKITSDTVPTLVGRMAFMEDPNGVRICLIQHD